MQSTAKSQKLNVSIHMASPLDITELRKDMEEFYAVMSKNPINKNEFVFIARDPKQKQGKIIGFVKGRIIHEGEERIGEILVISVRKGFKGRSIGPKLLGKANSYFIAKRIKRAELVSFNDEFYMKRSNYRARASDADEFESSIKTLEAKLKRNHARKRIVQKNLPQSKSIGPQNILNKEKWIMRRSKLK